MRHAKAGELPGGPDAERALRPRGRRNAVAAGQWLAGRGILPDLVLCSAARRARQTWQHVGGELTGQPKVVADPRLYQADAGDLLGVFSETPPDVRSLMYVGHNPAAADLVEMLTGSPVEFPTAAVAILALAVSWSDLADLPGSATDLPGGAAELTAFWFPQADVG